MIVSTNLKERLKTAGLLFLQSYKILMGTMISVFVPQKCYVENTDEFKLCTMTENFNNDEYNHRVTLLFNGFTAASFILLYLVEMRRETWLIKHLDIDHSLADNNLENIVYKKKALLKMNNDNIPNNHNNVIIINKDLEKISRDLIKYNKRYFYGSLATSTVFLVNNLASINILKNNHYGSTTLNTYISFLMLIMMKLYNAVSVSYRSKRDTKALSAYMIEFSSFNTLDKGRYVNNVEEESEPEPESNDTNTTDFILKITDNP
jgi:hypothetical protein